MVAWCEENMFKLAFECLQGLLQQHQSVSHITGDNHSVLK